MGTAIQDPYLAESIGFASGRRRGMEAGYHAAWDEAEAQANAIIAQKNAEIARLTAELGRANQHIAQGKERLDSVKANFAEWRVAYDELEEQYNIQRGAYENLFKSFLGVVAMAQPAIKAVARLPFAQRDEVLNEYDKVAVDLLSADYIQANRFPHNQPLIKKHLPIGHSVYTQIALDGIALEKEQNRKAQEVPA